MWNVSMCLGGPTEQCRRHFHTLCRSLVEEVAACGCCPLAMLLPMDLRQDSMTCVGISTKPISVIFRLPSPLLSIFTSIFRSLCHSLQKKIPLWIIISLSYVNVRFPQSFLPFNILASVISTVSIQTHMVVCLTPTWSRSLTQAVSRWNQGFG